MKKRLAILLSTIGLTSAAFAVPVTSFNGFYAGAGIGGTFTQAELSGATDSLYSPGFFLIENINPLPSDLRRDSFTGNIHLGYGHQLGQSPLYLGAEVFGDFANREMNNTQVNLSNINVIFVSPPTAFASNTISTTTQVKLNTGEFGVDLHPGILLDQNTLLSGIVGVAFNKLQINSNNSQVTAFNPDFIELPAITSTFQSSASKNVAGLRLGGEVQERFNNHWGLSADYIYTDYGKINTSAVGDLDLSSLQPGLVFPNTFTANASARVHTDTVMLGLDYYFSGSQEAT